MRPANEVPVDEWSPVDLRDEVEFLRALVLDASDIVGSSAEAMLRVAYEGGSPRWFPADKGDLQRCERVYTLAPMHLKTRMANTLELFRLIHGVASGSPTRTQMIELLRAVRDRRLVIDEVLKALGA